MPAETDSAHDSTAIRGGESHVYAAEGDAVVHYVLDTAVPALERRSSVMLPATVQLGCRHSTMNRLYVASSNGGYAAYVAAAAAGDDFEFVQSTEHYLTVFEVAPTGDLAQLGESVQVPYRPVYVSLDHTSTHLLVAYSDPAAMTIHTILDDGRLGSEWDQPKVEMKPYAHQIKASPNDDFVAVCCTGQIIDPTVDPSTFVGALHAFAYDKGTIGDVLSETSPNGGLFFSPRNLEFHPTLPLAYLALERENEVLVYRYDSDGFESEPLYRSSTLVGGASKGKQCLGVIEIHPSGRFLYVANRTMGTYEEGGRRVLTKGGDDIAVFELDLDTGRPTLLQRIDAEGAMPRSMALDLAGELLVVSNQFEVEGYDGDVLKTVPQALMIYRIGADGRLEPAGRHELPLGSKAMGWMDLYPV